MRVKVRHRIDKLAADQERAIVEVKTGLPKIARENVDYGRDLAKALAREKAGPHGKNYHKRITSEMRGPLTGEYGPEGIPKSDFVGVGFRNGRNRDLPQTADKVLISTSADVRKLIARLFR